MKKIFICLIALFMFVTGGCSQEAASEPGGKEPGADGEQVIAVDEAYKISSAGDGSWQLQIPEGIFSEESLLRLQPLSEADQAALESEGVSLIGSVVEIKVADSQSVRLNVPVRVTMQLSEDQIPTEGSVDDLIPKNFVNRNVSHDMIE